TDRKDALDALTKALQQISIGDVKTTLPLHKALAADPAVQAGQFHTQFLEPWLESHTLTADQEV
ncbi:MAG: acetyl-CoA carboxylase biotin carboxylase subunit, partial [Pseudomonadota bacterium]